MKKRIALEQVKPGSRFSEDVFIDDENLLVPANIEVRQKDLDVLKRWGVAFVVTEGSLVVESASPAAQRPSEAAMQKPREFAGKSEHNPLYSDLVERLTGLYEKIRKSEPVETRAIDRITEDLLGLVSEERESAIAAVLVSQDVGTGLSRAGVNTAILSSVIGVALKLPAYKLSYLASGALVHDAGMLRIPESIVNKKGVLSEDEVQKMRAHPLLSYKIITKELLYPDDVGLIGLQHHERWDSEGYPRKMGGGDIDLLARIVSIADAFEAMVSARPYRNPMIGYAAIKALLSDNSRRFDPAILKAFIRSMGIYPLGSTVLLNNAAIARVIETNPNAPLRPRLRIIVDEFGKSYEGEEGDAVDLVAEKTLFIARVLDPNKMAGA